MNLPCQFDGADAAGGVTITVGESPGRPVAPVLPVGPWGPAGPGVTTGIGTTTVGLSQALKPKATNAAVIRMTCFILIPLSFRFFVAGEILIPSLCISHR